MGGQKGKGEVKRGEEGKRGKKKERKEEGKGDEPPSN